MPRAAKVTAVEILGRPRVDKDHVGFVVVAMLPEPSRVDTIFSDAIASTYRSIPTASPIERNPSRRSKSASPALILLDHARAFVDERGVKFDQRRARPDVQPCVLGAADAADADDREFSVGVPYGYRGSIARANRQRTPAESARMRRRNPERLARDRSVARDDSVDAQLERGIADSNISLRSRSGAIFSSIGRGDSPAFSRSSRRTVRSSSPAIASCAARACSASSR